MTSNLKVIYKVNPKHTNQISFFVTNGSETRQIGLIEMPMDNMLGNNVKTADEIVVALRKRLRSSD